VPGRLSLLETSEHEAQLREAAAGTAVPAACSGKMLDLAESISATPIRAEHARGIVPTGGQLITRHSWSLLRAGSAADPWPAAAAAGLVPKYQQPY
jgi:hypothetical protein